MGSDDSHTRSRVVIAPWDWRRTSLVYLISAAAWGFALGILANMRLSQRFLTQLITANNNDGTFAINGSAAFDWEDGLCAHIVAYAGRSSSPAVRFSSLS